MKNRKRKVLSAIVLCFAVLLTGCTHTDRINTAELERRMAQYDERLAFFDGEVFYNKQTFYTFLNFESPRDVLLTIKSDKYGRVTRVSATAEKSFAGKTGAGFETVCLAAAAALLPEDADSAGLVEQAGLYDETAADAGGFSVVDFGKYNLRVFRSTGAVTFTIDVKEYSGGTVQTDITDDPVGTEEMNDRNETGGTDIADEAE